MGAAPPPMEWIAKLLADTFPEASSSAIALAAELINAHALEVSERGDDLDTSVDVGRAVRRMLTDHE